MWTEETCKQMKELENECRANFTKKRHREDQERDKLEREEKKKYLNEQRQKPRQVGGRQPRYRSKKPTFKKEEKVIERP